ncbi:MAG: glycosyltransferase family 39 protein [Pseudomonadota bacterium]|nr:glycosyltransferase family 39 protein [Pseudomonadota bacterium]
MSQPKISLESRLATLPFWPVIAVILIAEGILLIGVLPAIEGKLGSYYWFSFVDDYDKLALSLSHGEGYRFTADTAPTLAREPGFPMFLSVIFYLFGYGIAAVRVANLLLAGVAAALTARLAASARAPAGVGIMAAVLFLIHPGVLAAEARGGVEMLYIVFTLLFLLALMHAIQRQKVQAFFIAGLMLGLTSSVRSTSLLFPAFLPIYLYFWQHPRPPTLRIAACTAAVALGAALVLTPWMIRNYMLVGIPVPTASVQGIAANAGQYICKHLSLNNGFQQLDTEASQQRAELALRDGYRFKTDYYLYFYDARDEVAFNGSLNKLALAEYRKSPALFAKCVSSNLFNYWFAGKNWTSTGLNFVIQLPYIILASIGAWITVARLRLPAPALLLLFLLYSMGVYLPIHAQARYSIPIIPLMAIFAAVTLGSWLRRNPPIEAT